MEALLVFSPPDPHRPLIQLLNDRYGAFDFSEESPLHTFRFNNHAKTYLNQPWDLAICWEPEPNGAYNDETKAKLRARFKHVREGFGKRENKDLFILKHNSGVNCHLDQDELVQGFSEYRCRQLLYSREPDIPNYRYICEIVEAIGKSDFANLSNPAMQFYRNSPLIDNMVNPNVLAYAEKFQEDLVCAKHAIRNLILKGEATLNSIAQSPPEKVKSHFLSLANKSETQIRDMIDTMQVLDMNWFQQEHADVVKNLGCANDLDSMKRCQIEADQAWGHLIRYAQENNDDAVKQAFRQYLTSLNSFCETAEFLKNLKK